MQSASRSPIVDIRGEITMSNFVEMCELNGLDPAAALEILNAQNWDDPECKSDPISDEQLKEINRLMGLIVGEPTNEQLEAIFRSVMRHRTGCVIAA
jgi:hypothetical protein